MAASVHFIFSYNPSFCWSTAPFHSVDPSQLFISSIRPTHSFQMSTQIHTISSACVFPSRLSRLIVHFPSIRGNQSVHPLSKSALLVPACLSCSGMQRQLSARHLIAVLVTQPCILGLYIHSILLLTLILIRPSVLLSTVLARYVPFRATIPVLLSSSPLIHHVFLPDHVLLGHPFLLYLSVPIIPPSSIPDRLFCLQLIYPSVHPAFCIHFPTSDHDQYPTPTHLVGRLPLNPSPYPPPPPPVYVVHTHPATVQRRPAVSSAGPAAPPSGPHSISEPKLRPVRRPPPPQPPPPSHCLCMSGGAGATDGATDGDGRRRRRRRRPAQLPATSDERKTGPTAAAAAMAGRDVDGCGRMWTGSGKSS